MPEWLCEESKSKWSDSNKHLSSHVESGVQNEQE